MFLQIINVDKSLINDTGENFLHFVKNTLLEK